MGACKRKVKLGKGSHGSIRKNKWKNEIHIHSLKFSARSLQHCTCFPPNPKVHRDFSLLFFNRLANQPMRAREGDNSDKDRMEVPLPETPSATASSDRKAEDTSEISS